MTTASVLVSPPTESDVVDRLVAGPLDRDGAERLYVAMFADVCVAVEGSGADLVVAVEADGEDGEDDAGDADEATAAVRAHLEDVLANPDEVEVEAREPRSGPEQFADEVLRLHEAGVTTAAIVEPTVPFLARRNVDSAAMKLRSSEVVLGPAPDGRVYFAAFSEPMDLRDALEPAPLEGLAGLAADDRSVDFVPMLPLLETAADLPTVLSYLRARVAAGRDVPKHTAEAVDEIGLTLDDEDGDLAIVAEDGA